MARTQEKRTQEKDRDKIEISQYILQKVPREAEVTRIEYEGPMLAVYTKKPEILVDQSSIVAEIVGVIRKRIVIRPDPSVRIPEVEAEKIARETIADNTRLFGPDYIQTAWASIRLSQALLPQSKYAEALNAATQGNAIFRKRISPG